MTPEKPAPDPLEDIWRGRLAALDAPARPPAGGEPSDWNAELALEAAWRSLKRPPDLGRNFAARVLASVDREGRAARNRNRPFWAILRQYLRPLAATAALGLAAVAGLEGWQGRNRVVLAQTIHEISSCVGDGVGVDTLRDFDAIRAFELEARAVDDLALMQTLAN
jgi:hypothetical protein